jgi:hypothetical protein
LVKLLILRILVNRVNAHYLVTFNYNWPTKEIAKVRWRWKTLIIKRSGSPLTFDLIKESSLWSNDHESKWNWINQFINKMLEGIGGERANSAT